MSKILYKAKRTDNHEWIEGVPVYPVCEYGKCYMIVNAMQIDERFGFGTNGNVRILHDAYEVDPLTVCQCIGMTDKNGKFIFENDIVLLLGTCSLCKIKVELGRREYVVSGVNGFVKVQLYGYQQNDIEVIGNIHDKEV